VIARYNEDRRPANRGAVRLLRYLSATSLHQLASEIPDGFLRLPFKPLIDGL
jgi:hypothetical protein